MWDILSLDREQQYGYNRYLDYLHVKASEAFTLKIEGEEKVKQLRSIEIAKNLIDMGLDNAMIAKGTGLTLAQIEQLRHGED